MKKTGWGKSSKWYNQIVGEAGHYYHRHLIMPTVLQLLALKPPESVLDLGCGQGVLARALSEKVSYTGVDISGALISQAKSLDTNPQHHFIVADVSRQIPLKQKFDHVVMILALQNIQNIAGVFDTIHTCLKPTGNLILVLNHPCFRIPRQSGWLTDPSEKLQRRWVNQYMSPMEIPVNTHPSQRSSYKTWSFHYPLSTLVSETNRIGLGITALKELVSDKESAGTYKKMENRSRAEIPLFMVIEAKRQ